MAKQPLRVNFQGAPSFILKQIFGEAKNASDILAAIKDFDGQAHEKEIFFWMNVDETGAYKTVQGSDGKPAAAMTMQNLKKQLAVMVETGQLKRLGDRSARYAFPNYEGPAPEDEDEGDEDNNAE